MIYATFGFATDHCLDDDRTLLAFQNANALRAGQNIVYDGSGRTKNIVRVPRTVAVERYGSKFVTCAWKLSGIGYDISCERVCRADYNSEYDDN